MLINIYLKILVVFIFNNINNTLTIQIIQYIIFKKKIICHKITSTTLIIFLLIPTNSLTQGLGESTVLPSSQSLNTTEDWEAAFKYVMMRNNNKHIDDQEELIRMQELQKRNLLNGLGGVPQQQQQQQYNNSFNTNEYNSDYFHNNPNDLNRMSTHSSLLNPQQQQQQQQQQQRGLGHIFVNKFFDFHKNQQQQQQTQVGHYSKTHSECLL
jgi:hypothetical protein